MVYALYQLIPTSSQLAFFKAVFLFLLTTDTNPLLELCLPCCMRLSRLLNPSHLPIMIASLNEDNCLAVFFAFFLDISSLLYRGEFPSSRQEQDGERGPWGRCHTQPFLTQEPLQVLSYHSIGVANNCPLPYIKCHVAENREKLRWCLKGEQVPCIQDGLWFPCCGVWQEGLSQSQLVKERRTFLCGEKWKRCF